MQVSKRKMNSTLEKELFSTMYQMIIDLKTPGEVDLVFRDLLSETELLTLAKRLAVAYWLSKGRSYQNIKNNLNVSSATIADVQQHVKKPGWKLALTKMTAEEWANQWERRIKKFIVRSS